MVWKTRIVKIFDHYLAMVTADLDRYKRKARHFSSERDVYCSDGVIAEGRRTITKTGSIRFANSSWQNDVLLPLAGLRVSVLPTDVYMTGIEIYTNYPGGLFLLSLENVLSPVAVDGDE